MTAHHLISVITLTAVVVTAGCKATAEQEAYEKAKFNEPEAVTVEIPLLVPMAEDRPLIPVFDESQPEISESDMEDMDRPIIAAVDRPPSFRPTKTSPTKSTSSKSSYNEIGPIGPIGSNQDEEEEIAPLPLLSEADDAKVVEEKKVYKMKGQLKPLPGYESEDVNALISKMLDGAHEDSMHFPVPEGFINSMTVYDYIPNAFYKIYMTPGRITAISFEEGELVQAVAAGDTVRWLVETVNSGAGDNARTNLFVKPLKPNIETNVVIATDRRMYNLEAHSLESSYMASVSWNYPYDANALDRNKMGIMYNRTAYNPNNNRTSYNNTTDTEVSNVSLTNLNFNYTISCDSKKMKNTKFEPVRVFDDGKKTFIQFSESASSYEAPVLFIKTSNEDTQLVNYRVRYPYYIVDRLFDKAELRIGNKKPIVITIERDS